MRFNPVVAFDSCSPKGETATPFFQLRLKTEASCNWAPDTDQTLCHESGWHSFYQISIWHCKHITHISTGRDQIVERGKHGGSGCLGKLTHIYICICFFQISLTDERYGMHSQLITIPNYIEASCPGISGWQPLTLKQYEFRKQAWGFYILLLLPETNLM